MTDLMRPPPSDSLSRSVRLLDSLPTSPTPRRNVRRRTSGARFRMRRRSSVPGAATPVFFHDREAPNVVRGRRGVYYYEYDSRRIVNILHFVEPTCYLSTADRISNRVGYPGKGYRRVRGDGRAYSPPRKGPLMQCFSTL